jgi:hypothetical protein
MRLEKTPNIIRAIKSRSMGWAVHVVCMLEMMNAYKIWSENLKGRDHSEELDVGGRLILEWFLEKQGGKGWTGFIWLRIGTSGRLM